MLITHQREKLIQAILYFAANTRACGKVKLFKLLYLLDFEHFIQTGKSVTGMEYRAWKLGPVPTPLVQEWERPEPDMAEAVQICPEQVFDHVRETVRPRAEFDPSYFTKRELRLLGDIVEAYRDTLSADMIDVTHAENGAWARVWNEGEGVFRPIPYELALAEGPESAAVLEASQEYRSAEHTLGTR